MTVQKIQGLELKRVLPQSKTQAADFGQKLAQARAKKLRFSAHAQTRLSQRKIKLTPEQLLKLEKAVEDVRKKGAKESLVLVDGLAFVVSVKNRTVITIAQRGDLREKIFTNIDSAVLVDEADRKGP